MSWTAAKDPGDTWFEITSGSSGTNSGTISVSYDENMGSARVGTITITAPGAEDSPQTVEIRQDAFNSYVEYKLTTSDEAADDFFRKISQYFRELCHFGC